MTAYLDSHKYEIALRPDLRFEGHGSLFSDPLALSWDSTRLPLGVQIPDSRRVMRWAAR